MMETILSFIATAVGELLDWIVEAFLGAMNLSLSDMVLTFPFLVDGYKLFRSIGIGLILCIAIWNLLKFFGGQITETRDTPLQLLIRAFVAGGMLWFGGYILEMVVDLSRIPFDTFVQADAVTMDFEGIVENFSDFAWFGNAATSLAIGGGTMLLISLILILLIGWNVLKLMVEVCERYLMIAVLVYSSPLIYPTVTSSSTAQIFKKWCGMFFGQCALMTLSAWMLKLICSGFSFTTSTHNVMFRLMLTLAMCKIAQRIDTYMQQLGIGVATTGGNLLDEAIGVGMAMARSGRSAAGRAEGASSKTAVLGAGADGSLSRMGGIFGGISNMVQKGVRDYKSGASTATIAQNARKNFMQGTGVGDSLKDWKDKTPEQRAKATGEAAVGFVTGGVIGNTIRSMQEARSTAHSEKNIAATMVKQSAKFDSAVNGNPKYQPPAGSGRIEAPNPANWSEAVRDAAKTSGMGTMQYAQVQRTAFGVGGIEEGGDRLGLNETAQKAGLSWLNNGPEVRGDRIETLTGEDGSTRTFTEGEAEIWNREYPKQAVMAGDEISAEQARMWNANFVEPVNSIEGPSDVAGDFIGANYAAAGIADDEHRDMNEAMINTVTQSPLAAEQALMNHYNDLQGNDDLGDALLKSAIGEEAIVGPLPRDATGNIQHGRFLNVSAKASENGSRLISADYYGADGIAAHYEIYNNNALIGPEKLMDSTTQLREGLNGKMYTAQTMASSEDVMIRRVEIPAEPMQPSRSGGQIGDLPRAVVHDTGSSVREEHSSIREDTPSERVETRREVRSGEKTEASHVQETETVQKVTIEDRKTQTAQQIPQANGEMITIHAKASNQKFQLRGKSVTQDTVDFSGVGASGAPRGTEQPKRGKSDKGSRK